MEQVLQPVAEGKICTRFHIVFYLHKGIQPVLSGVNVNAHNIVEAVSIFIADPQHDIDAILYVIKIEDL